MKKLEELGISPAPWKVKQDSGYDRESGDFNTYDSVCNAEGKVMVEWENGESYGDVWPTSEPDASLIAAAPDMYAAIWDILFKGTKITNCRNCKGHELGNCGGCPLGKARAALEKAGGAR